LFRLSLTGFESYTFSLYVDFALTGLSLIDASVAPSIPEPETYAMMCVGLGLVGWQLRRNSKRLAASRLLIR
jgi:uncharacterized membrane protein YesL